MNFVEVLCLIISSSVYSASGFPQSSNEVAAGTKLNEQSYYNKDAPGLLPFDNPTDIDNAKEESEGYGSRIDSVYDGLQKKHATLFNKQPLIDGLKEAEKYGNNGDPIAGLSKIVVTVMSVVSNVVNKVVDAPVVAVQTIVANTNKVLNRIGGNLVGLRK